MGEGAGVSPEGAVDQDLYRLLLERLPVTVYVMKGKSADDVVFTYMSPGRTPLDYDPQQYTDDPDFWRSVTHPNDLARVVAGTNQAMNSGEPYLMEYREIGPDGRVIWVQDQGSVIDEAEDGTRTWLAINMAITDRKETELRLAEAEERYRVIVEELPAIVYQETTTTASYPEAAMLYWNPQLARLLGYDEDEVGTGEAFWNEIVHPHDRDRVLAEAARTVKSREPYKQEYRLVAKDGSTRWLYDEAVLLREDPDGTQVWQGVAMDITERVLAEEQLTETIGLLQRTDRDRKRLLSELVRAQEEERRRIAEDIHDDSVQALAAIALRLDTLMRTLGAGHAPSEEEQLEPIRELVTGAMDRLRRLLFDLRPQVLDAEGFVAALRVLLSRMTEQGMETKLDSELALEPSPETRVIAFRIAGEALANVSKHARAKTVRVEVGPENEGIRVRIRDNGRGFDAARESERVLPGHFGVNSMRERAELAGGRIEIESAEGKGTLVDFWLPGDIGERQPG